MAHVTSARENTNGLPRVPSIPLADETAGTDEQSIGNLVKDATLHLSTLVRAEVELAKSEVVGEIKKGLTGSVYFIVALVLLLLLMPFLLTAAALGINKGLWDWAQPWGGFFVIVLLMGLAAGLLAWRGAKKVKGIRAPQRTISTMKDTAAALRSRGETGEEAGGQVAVPVGGDPARRD
jgi:Putative Actinobacterial Holin-X, holin superfamily III